MLLGWLWARGECCFCLCSEENHTKKSEGRYLGRESVFQGEHLRIIYIISNLVRKGHAPVRGAKITNNFWLPTLVLQSATTFFRGLQLHSGVHDIVSTCCLRRTGRKRRPTMQPRHRSSQSSAHRSNLAHKVIMIKKIIQGRRAR